MEYTMFLFVTRPDINKHMRLLDLLPNGKYFYNKYQVIFEPTAEINDDYFLDFIYESKNKDSDEFVVAISCMGNFYYHHEAKILSDGINEFFTIMVGDK